MTGMSNIANGLSNTPASSNINGRPKPKSNGTKIAMPCNKSGINNPIGKKTNITDAGIKLHFIPTFNQGLIRPSA